MELFARMQIGILAGLTFLGGMARGEVLRISEVVQKASGASEEMVLIRQGGDDENNETLLVGKEAIITRKHVESVIPVTRSRGRGKITLQFNEEGSERFRVATERLATRNGRLAIIVDGDLIMAPILHGPITGGVVEISFPVNTLHDLHDIARRMEGKGPLTDEQDATLKRSKPQTIPFTDEEYAEIKRSREEMGIYFLDSVPSQEELDRMLKVGMTEEQLVAILGNPSQKLEQPLSWMYQLAPEKRPGPEYQDTFPGGIHVHLSGGKLTAWSHFWTDAAREEKSDRPDPLLVATFPTIDPDVEEIDMIAYVEGMRVENLKQKVNESDLDDLLGTVINLGSLSRFEPDRYGDDADIDAHCDFLKILGRHFPEAKALRKESESNRVQIKQLFDALEPYAMGDKPVAVAPEE